MPSPAAAPRRAAPLVGLCACLLTASAGAAEPRLTAEEKAKFEGACKPYMELFAKVTAKVKESKEAQEQAKAGKPISELLGQAMIEGKASTGLSEAEFQDCNQLMIRSMREFKMRSAESEPRVALKLMAKAIREHYEENKTLCPASKQPVPPELSQVADGTYQFQEADWEDPAWACVLYRPGVGGRQRFQYELKTNPKKKTFELIARGYPAGDDELVTLFVTGELGLKTPKVSDVQSR